MFGVIVLYWSLVLGHYNATYLLPTNRYRPRTSMEGGIVDLTPSFDKGIT